MLGIVSVRLFIAADGLSAELQQKKKDRKRKTNKQTVK